MSDKNISFEEFIKINFKIIGTPNEIVVSLGKPQKDLVYKFYCPYQIDSPYESIKHRSAGVDELKSVQNAISMINTDLKKIARSNSVVLQRLGHAEGDLGFEEWDVINLTSLKEKLKYDKSLSLNERGKLKESVQRLEIQQKKRSQRKYSPEMQALRKKRNEIMEDIKKKGKEK